MAHPPLGLGIDVGGTFVDCAVVRGDELVASGKAPTSAADPVQGVLDAVGSAAATLGLTGRSLLAAADRLVHGTTLGLNALLTRSGATVGLLATRGHEDVLLIGRVHQKVAGLGPEELIRVSELEKPEPIVPRRRTHGIHERVDATGAVVVRLDEDGVAEAVERLVRDGCEALAISFLWSFRNPAHERRAAAVARSVRRGLPVCLSSEVAPLLGEYERTAATVVNAYLIGTESRYLDRLSARLEAHGFAGRLGMLLSSGAVAELSDVRRRPVETLRSGPVGGAIAAARLGRDVGATDVLATDVGGTSFDVSLIHDGRPAQSHVTLAGRLHLAVSSVEVLSIGAGGGSIAWLDEDRGVHVGPQSAGADPGPACYGRGGEDATVTDADLVLGRLNPAAVLGGQIRLEPSAAEEAVGRLGQRLGLDAVAMASGIIRVADAHMADLVRRITVERGHDPRTMLLVAYGGAAGLHAAAYGFDAGVREIVVPIGASVYSSLGLAGAVRGRLYQTPGPALAPLDSAAVRRVFRAMERRARTDLVGVDLELRREIDFRFRRQTHRLGVALEPGRLDVAALDRAVERFEQEYARVFGPEAGYRGAGIEAVMFRLEAQVARDGSAPTGQAGRPRMDPATAGARPRIRRPRRVAERPVFFGRWIGRTPIYDGTLAVAGDTVDGPAVIEWPTTSLVVHRGQRMTIDPLGHARLVRAPA
jgi:N-methylhydantoinase A